MGEAGKEALTGQIKHGSESPGDSGRAPDTSDSQANRVDRIHVGYVDERARFIDTSAPAVEPRTFDAWLLPLFAIHF